MSYAAQPSWSTIEHLRKLLREDMEEFVREVDRLIAETTDPQTRDFWVAVKASAEDTAKKRSREDRS